MSKRWLGHGRAGRPALGAAALVVFGDAGRVQASRLVS